MDIRLAEKIVRELKKFSDKKFAVCNEFGEVLARTKDFTFNHPRVDLSSNRIIKIQHSNKSYGYIFMDESLATIKEIGGIVKSMAELIIHQDHYTKILTSDEKRIDQLAYDFFYENSINQDDLKKVFLSFGIDLSKDRVAIFVEISVANYLLLFDKNTIEGEKEKMVVKTKRSIESVLSSFYTNHTENIVFYLGSNNFLILKDMGDNPTEYQKEFKKTLNALYFNLIDELRTKLTIGVGNYKKGIEGIKESFQESRTSIKFGKQIWGEENIFHFDSFGVIAPLFSGVNKENVSFSNKVIRRLSKHNELLKTLETFLKNDLSLSKTAKIAGIHRNTLVYRLGKIEEITNLDPRNFDDAFQLQMALILDRYNK